MIRVPDSRTQDMRLESLSPGQLFSLFETFLKTKTTAISHSDLVEAWGLLFSSFYLSAAELVDGMQKGEHPLGRDREDLLREFVRADFRSGGAFVLEVIEKGGNIDRAALIMIASPEDLGGLVHRGSTALHLFATACDRTIRPAFIVRAGRKALAERYDSRGLPALFTIFSLNDLRRDDLDAIAQVFSRDDLKNTRNKNRIGRNALEVFTEASERLKVRVPGERNPFIVSHAVKNASFSGEHAPHEKPGSENSGEIDVTDRDRTVDVEPQEMTGQERYRDLLPHQPDSLERMARRKPGQK